MFYCRVSWYHAISDLINAMPTKKNAHSLVSDSLKTPDNLGFEEAMAELEQLVLAVENNRLPLEETLQTYQRGQGLIERCSHLLRDAERRIQQFEGDRLTELKASEQA